MRLSSSCFVATTGLISALLAPFLSAQPVQQPAPASSPVIKEPVAPADNYTPPQTMRDERLQPKPQPGKPDTAPLAHVETRGKGPLTMILIPGHGCDWSIWDDFMTRNADRYTMLAVTLPGFAGTDAPAVKPGSTFADLAWLDNAEWAVVQLLDERKIEKPVIVGQGLGGLLALRIGAHHPDRPGAVIDIHGYPAFPFPGAKMPVETKPQRAAFISATGGKMYETMSDGAFDFEVQHFAQGVTMDKERAKGILAMLRKAPRPVYTRYFFEYLAEDLTGEVSAIKAPILMVVASEVSRAIDLPQSNEMEWRPLMAGAPKAHWAFINRSLEMVMIDQPKQTDDAIDGFLKTVLSGDKK
ncbi:MAG TPA: alpha/beta hydrolase [Phycisphaerales bacterium]|nr:alpha/beta hydrolase [Phycisphaerales bacterium]